MARHQKKKKDESPADDPQWRKDFPVDVAEDHYIARRDFTKFMVLISFAFVFGQWWIGVQNWRRKRRGQPPIQAIAAAEQVPVGGAVQFNYPGAHDSCLLLRTDEDTFLAYGDQCTHLMCAVRPQFDKGLLHCPCHQGFFDMATGRAAGGPPRRPLPRIQLKISQGVVYATGVEVSTL
jgi:Rieske Fe-S protein